MGREFFDQSEDVVMQTKETYYFVGDTKALLDVNERGGFAFDLSEHGLKN